MKKIGKIMFADTMSKFEYPYQNWYFPLKRHCEKIVNFDVRWNNIFYGKDLMNKRFLKFIEREKPDHIFMWIVSGRYEFDTLLKIREVSPKTQVFFVLQDDDAEFDNFSRYFVLFADYGLTLHKTFIEDYKKQGFENIYYSAGIDAEFFKPMNLPKKYDVVFIGCPKSGPSMRCEFIKFLIDNGIKVKLFGYGWDDYPEFKSIYGGMLESEEMIKVLNQTKIYLNLTRNGFGENTDVKAKIFEGGACKVFVLNEFGPAYLDLFKEHKEMITFRTEKELLEKVKYYLKNDKERERMAEISYKKIRRVYALDVELDRIFREVYLRNKELGHKPLPKVDKEIVCFTKRDMNLDGEVLKKKLEGIDYIYFKEGKVEDLKYRKYLQAFSLEKTGRPISCCDYYVSNGALKDYLYFHTKRFFKLYEGRLNKFLSINQFMVTRRYFLDNIDKFKEFFDGKEINIVNEKDVSFVSFPLIRLNKVVIEDDKIMKYAYDYNFLYHLYSLKSRKRIFSELYVFGLFFEILKGKKFIWTAIMENLKDKSKRARLESFG